MANRSDDYADYPRFSLDIERGNGDEEMAHSTSARIRPGSRAPSSRASSGQSSRYHSNFTNFPRNQENFNGSIQILQDGFDDEEEWLLEDVSDDNEHDLESMESGSPVNLQTDFQQPYQTFSERYTNQQLAAYRTVDPRAHATDDSHIQRQLVVRGDRGIVEVDTDEENDIVNKIKNEITQQVKAEIKDEIKHLTYKEKPEQDEEDIDPMVKEALLQMRKFDRILEKRTKRERRVKRERIALQKKLRVELDELNKERPSGCKGTKDETVNTEKFLSLPPSIARLDREVAENSEDDDDWSGAPLFATQPPMFDGASSKSFKSNKTSQSRKADDDNSTGGSQSTNKTGDTTNRSKKHRRRRPMHDADGNLTGDKDFIQRNIDLAADAGNAVAMTDDEKKRLADILENLDEMNDQLLDQEPTTSHIVLRPGEGFALDTTTQHAMKEIDRKLEGLMGADEYNSILAPSTNLTYDSLQLFSRTHNDNSADITEIGERALQETREYRDQQKRLADIERELGNLSSAVQSEIESPMLTDQQLHVLLDQCNRMMSRATIETDSLSQANSPRSAQSSTRDSTVAVQPHLDDSVLRSLLNQARAEGIISRNSRASPQPDEDSELITDNQRESLLINPRTTSRAAVH